MQFPCSDGSLTHHAQRFVPCLWLENRIVGHDQYVGWIMDLKRPPDRTG